MTFSVVAALAGGVGVTALGQAAQRLGPARTAAWTGIFGIVLGPLAALDVSGAPGPPGPGWLWAFAAGGASMLGNGLFLFATERGNVALVAPIVASAGGIAALMAAVAGAAFTGDVLLGGLILTAGVILAARATPGAARAGRGEKRPGSAASPLRQVALAAASALALAISYLLIARTQQLIGASWAYVALMIEVLVTWALPQAIRGLLRPARFRELWWVLVGEVAGIAVFLSYGRAAGDNRAIASVIYGQYAIVAALIAMLVFRERLSRPQVAGVALAVIGTFILTLNQR